MQPVLAALISNERTLTNAAAVISPPPSVACAIETLLNDSGHLITSVTVSQSVSSEEEGEAIGSAVRRIASEHHLSVEASLHSGHLRVRLSRLTGQHERPDAEE